MIELGLSRVARLLQHTPLPWRAIHVAGTNGKGSICAYASAMLHAAGIRAGTFTSPHLIDRWDCISIAQRAVDESTFHRAEETIKQRDAASSIGASEFELLTATAYQIFTDAQLDTAVVEVGMGGRLDATNIIEDPYVTVISKIGLDHQAFLGNTLTKIAREKAGIMKPGAPCIVDATNEVEVRRVFGMHARSLGAGPIMLESGGADSSIWSILCASDFEPHQRVNIAMAVSAVQSVLRARNTVIGLDKILSAVGQVQWPGRLQYASIESLTGRMAQVLIDGAHNEQSALALAGHVDRRLRENGRPVTWLMALSAGKDARGIFSSLFRTGDRLVLTGFGPVAGMPWVQAAASRDLLEQTTTLEGVQLDCVHDAGPDLKSALRLASETSAESPLVVAGSLYLVGDLLRMMRRGPQ